jgi:tetratricopeptide (TPR) repeat protein
LSPYLDIVKRRNKDDGVKLHQQPSSRHRSAPRNRPVRPRIHLVVRLLYPAYIRGLAYLELGDGRSAAGEFQKLIDNPGLCSEFVTCPLARLQMGRAKKLMGDNSAALESYQEFLTIWKDADPDLPIYRQAKAEYAQLKK